MQIRLDDRLVRIAGSVALIAALAACTAPSHQVASAPGAQVAPAAAPENRTTVAPQAKTYTSIHTLNLRLGPNHRFAAKTVLPIGTVVTPNGYVSGSWWQVDTQNFGTGWVDSTGLKPNAS
jgi:uncharacterized protein YgiM (DUF1202 family)